MLTKVQKKEIVNELADKIKRQKSLIFTDVTGVNVAEIQDLRRRLRETGIEYKVAKKTLIDLALKKGLPEQFKKIDVSQFAGTLGLAFGYEDPLAPVKVLDNFAKEHKNLRILGGITEDKVLGVEEVKELAKIPSKDELLANLINSIKAPIRGFVNVLEGNIRNLVGVLNGIISK